MNREATRRARLARRKRPAMPDAHLQRALGATPLVTDPTRPVTDPREVQRVAAYLLASPALKAEAAALQAEGDRMLADADTPAEAWAHWRLRKALWHLRRMGAQLALGSVEQ